MATSNGNPVTTPESGSYRPTASTSRVYDRVIRSLSNVVHASTYEAFEFITLFDNYDRDKPIADRFQHLVDATECLQLALTYLDQLMSAAQQRRLIDDEHHTGTTNQF